MQKVHSVDHQCDVGRILAGRIKLDGEKVQRESHREGTNQMERPAGLRPPEERARITEIQNWVIGLFVEHRKALENEDNLRARTLETAINNLLHEKDEIRKWAVVGSA
jgi:hypothetical protein